MDYKQTIEAARESIDVKRVYSEPYERNGVTVISAAAVQGGAGGGGREEESTSDGGSGFGLQARPVGAFVIRGDDVRWQPAVDVNRLVLGALALAGLVVWRGTRRGR